MFMRAEALLMLGAHGFSDQARADGWPLSGAVYAKQTREAPARKQGHLFADSVTLPFSFWSTQGVSMSLMC